MTKFQQGSQSPKASNHVAEGHSAMVAKKKLDVLTDTSATVTRGAKGTRKMMC